MNRKVLWPILLIGAALVAAPFALSLPTKATAGERMIRDCQPIMQPGSVPETAPCYDEGFVPLGQVAPLMGEATVAKFSGYLEGFAGVQADAARLVRCSRAHSLTPAETQDYLGRSCRPSRHCSRACRSSGRTSAACSGRRANTRSSRRCRQGSTTTSRS